MDTPTPASGTHYNPYSGSHTPSQASGTSSRTRTTPPPHGNVRSVQKRRGMGKTLLGWFVVILGSLLVSSLIREYVIGNHYVFSASMEPTMKVGERFITLRPAIHPDPPKHGDIILFKDTGDWMENGSGEEDAMLKRVIALPGDTVEANRGVVYLNGVALDEPYTEGVTSWFPEQTVPDGYMWVMGDNRERSADSRAHIENGTQFVPMDSIIGWPWGRYQPDLALY